MLQLGGASRELLPTPLLAACGRRVPQSRGRDTNHRADPSSPAAEPRRGLAPRRSPRAARRPALRGFARPRPLCRFTARGSARLGSAHLPPSSTGPAARAAGKAGRRASAAAPRCRRAGGAHPPGPGHPARPSRPTLQPLFIALPFCRRHVPAPPADAASRRWAWGPPARPHSYPGAAPTGGRRRRRRRRRARCRPGGGKRRSPAHQRVTGPGSPGAGAGAERGGAGRAARP